MLKNRTHKKIKTISKNNTNAWYIPFMFDPIAKRPSITITFTFFTFIIALASTIASHFKTSLAPITILTIIFWALSVIFYLIRKITNASVDFKKRSIVLQNNSSKE